jgi:hypothetical protein
MSNDSSIFFKLETIQSLLIEAYNHYFTHETHCKPSEGVVSLHYPTYWEMRGGNFSPSVEISSYVFGPSRQNHFDNIDDALEAVKEWYEKELANASDNFEDFFLEKEEFNVKVAKI